MMLTESDLAPVFDRIRKGALGILHNVAANGTYEMPPNTPVLPNEHVVGTLNDLEKAFFSTAKILERDLMLIAESMTGNGKKPNGMDFLHAKVVGDINTVYECLIQSIQDRFGLCADRCYGIAIRRGYAIILLPFAPEKVSEIASETACGSRD